METTDARAFRSDSDVCAGFPRLAMEDLPPAGTKRWVVRRKAQIVNAVRDGIITLEEACARYTLSIEEFRSWQRLIESHGVPGLRTTRLQDYRAVDKN